jgi:hypothetical protein
MNKQKIFLTFKIATQSVYIEESLDALETPDALPFHSSSSSSSSPPPASFSSLHEYGRCMPGHSPQFLPWLRIRESYFHTLYAPS